MNNVVINGRSAVHADSGGTLMTVDVCLTHCGNTIIPIPYPNIAQSKDADKTAATVFVNDIPVCTKDSVFSKSKGDEPGNKKGVKSGKKGAEASFLTSSPNVHAEGSPMVRALDVMVSNAQNTPPAPLVQATGLPPFPGTVSQPEALANSEQPHRTGVTQDGNFSIFQGVDLIEDDEA